MSGFNQGTFNRSPFNRPESIQVTASDKLTPVIAENAAGAAAAILATDSLATQFAETPVLTATIPTSTDTLILAIADAVKTLDKFDKLLRGIDKLALRFTTETAGIAATVSAADILVITPFESNPFVANHLGTDTLPVRFAAETSSYEEWFIKQVSDSLAIRWATEKGSLSYNPEGTDTFAIALGEVGDWIDFWRACNLPRRRIYGKAEIVFSDPFVAEGGINITAPECSYPSTTASLIDGKASVPGKWFTFKTNLLDGNSLLCPRVDDYKADYTTGWWSDTLSDENGVFNPGIEITLEFPTRPLHEVKMIGDPYLGGLPRDFSVWIYSGETLLTTEGIFVDGNENYNWSMSFETPYQDVTKIAYVISKINDPFEQCRILELFSIYKEEYDENEIKSIRILEELDYDSGSVPIGNISSNEVVLTLTNPDRRFDPSNPESPIRHLMMKHRKIKVWLGVLLSPTTGIVWQPMGVFYSMDWSAPDDSLFAEVMGLDRLEILRNTDFAPPGIYNYYTIGDLLEEVFEDAGVTASEYIIDRALYGEEYRIPYAWFDRTSSRYAVQKLAESALAFVYCDREGKINVRLYSPGTAPVVEFNRDNYYTRDHPLRWSEMVNSLEVIATPRQPSESREVYRDMEVFVVKAGETVERFYMFNQTPVYGEITTIVTADKEGLTFETTPYPWSARIWFTNPTETDITVSGIVHSGSVLEKTGGLVAEASDQTSINHNGRVALSSPLELEFIQTRAQAQHIANKLIEMYADPQRDVILNTRGYLSTMLGDRVGVSNYQDDPAVDYNIVRQEIEWSGPLRINVTARKVIEEE
jgi:hypothetical protein